MKKYEFQSDNALGARLIGLDRQSLCEFVVKLCEKVKADVGAGAYRGGIYPENISVSDKGEIAIGRVSPNNWQGQELAFLPPELYWNGRPGPAADVYSIGMLLYYALSGGTLPFDGTCRDPQLRRMSGEAFEIPASFGRRLGDIVRKTTAFKAADRYQSMDELRVMVESCLKNLYLNGTPSAEAIFNKSDDDLSELEKLMVGIIEKEEEEPLPEEEILSEVQETEAVQEAAEEESEEFAGDELSEDEQEFEEEDEAQPAQEVSSEDYFPTSRPHVPRLYEERNPELEPVVLKKQPDIIPAVRYTKDAERERRMRENVKKRRRRPVAVILVLCAVLIICAIIFNALIRDINRGQGLGARIAQNIQTDAVTGADPNAQGESGQQAESAEQGGEATGTEAHSEETESTEPQTQEEPVSDNVLNIQPDSVPDSYVPGGVTGYIPGQPQQGSEEDSAALEDGNSSESGFIQGPAYQLIKEDISWTEAQAKCIEMGGHLAVINDADEFAEIIALADQHSVSMLWLGGHRENSVIVWEDGSPVAYENWAAGEPSVTDSSDGAAEDYVLLWYNRGWFYNDSRNDPCAEFPQWYGGKMAYVCEMG